MHFCISVSLFIDSCCSFFGCFSGILMETAREIFIGHRIFVKVKLQDQLKPLEAMQLFVQIIKFYHALKCCSIHKIYSRNDFHSVLFSFPAILHPRFLGHNWARHDTIVAFPSISGCHVSRPRFPSRFATSKPRCQRDRVAQLLQRGAL